jgi:hypothetical protein
MPHEHKAVTLHGVIKALRARGLYDQVLARVSEPTRLALGNVVDQRYHPGTVLDETLGLVAELSGVTAVEEVMATVSRDSLAGIAGPLAKLFMTMAGGGPRPVLERFDTLISSSTRGFSSAWTQRDATSGSLTITTDVVTGAIAEHSWKGSLEYVLTFAGVKGTVTILPRTDQGRALHFELSWTS